MKLGEIRTIKEVCRERMCEECENTATKKITFLYPNARRNPASSAYGRDDCSWCQDEEKFVCLAHEKNKYQYERDLDMGWCSTFDKERFEHMFLYWDKISETVEVEATFTK